MSLISNNNMKNKNYSESDNQFLKENYGKMLVIDISKKLNRTPSSIRARANVLKLKSIIPFSKITHSKIGKINTKQIKKSAFLPSKELSYLIGILNGDGSLNIKKKKNYAFKLSVKDKDFALKFKKIVEKWCGIKCCFYLQKDIYHKQGFYYEIKLNSKEAIPILSNYYIHKNKNLKNIKKFINQKKEYQIKFIEGFFDSEGHINKNGRIYLFNKNKTLLNYCSSIFEKLNIKTTLYLKKAEERKIRNTLLKPTDIFVLNINSKKDTKIFCQIFNSSIKRKQDRILKIRNSIH